MNTRAIKASIIQAACGEKTIASCPSALRPRDDTNEMIRMRRQSYRNRGDAGKSAAKGEIRRSRHRTSAGEHRDASGAAICHGAVAVMIEHQSAALHSFPNYQFHLLHCITLEGAEEATCSSTEQNRGVFTKREVLVAAVFTCKMQRAPGCAALLPRPPALEWKVDIQK
ncbi:hypothetical protein EYF80_040100 [Liparis tanakae]|uniref:Uncharacterized protein n=1 Tax=Liparis tanakae TaxID=230148 RepID=A0A4Z2G9H4_9TELE|nr:hypothetical protein EYF80_040100 [Liparis tanakae]